MRGWQPPWSRSAPQSLRLTKFGLETAASAAGVIASVTPTTAVEIALRTRVSAVCAVLVVPETLT